MFIAFLSRVPRKDVANSKIGIRKSAIFVSLGINPVMGCIIDVNFNNYTEITRIFDRVYIILYRGRLERMAMMHVSGRRVEASLRSVPPRVSNFFLSVSRSTDTAANAKADLSRCAFIRVEEAMRNWPRPMKIGTIYVTHDRCIFHLLSLSSHSFSRSIRMKWTLTRGRVCDICQDVSSSPHRIDRSLFLRPNLSLSLSRLLLCQPRDRKRKWPRRILSGRKTATSRRTSRPMIAWTRALENT